MIKHKRLQKNHPSGEAGFTIIESLVALVVVAVLLTAIAPVIVLSTANRLQARRVELATLAAKTYIDGVKSGAIALPPPITTSSVDFPATAPTETSLNCPQGNTYCTLTTSPKKYELFCVDGDTGGCTNNSKDLLVQAFGYNQNTNDASRGYRLGLRVYRGDAFKSGNILKASKDGTQFKQQQSFGANTKSFIKVQALTPLVEMATDISADKTSFDDLCGRLKPTSSTTNPNSKC